MRQNKRAWGPLIAMCAALVAGLILAGCGAQQESSSTSAEGATPVAGGMINFYINEPAFIDPLNAQESEGIQVVNAVFDSLVSFDYKTQELLPAAAESWSVNADATVWTFKLRDASFHNGQPVTAADFKYAWERICNPANGSEISYHLAPVKGYEAMQNGTAAELEGVKAVDDKTLEVTLSYPFGDFEYVVGHPGLGPVPKAEVEKDPKAFAEMPIGNGPFKMMAPWQHDQEIQVARFADYYGAKPYVDGVDFKIFKDEDTAFLEFKAGNLDFTSIPSGQVAAAKAEYGESRDGLEVSPGEQVLSGPETAIYYLVLNNKDETLKNVDVRRALSLAINREAIATAVFEGVRQPATGIVPEGVAGYLTNQWAYSKYDIQQAIELLAKAGYPGGQGLPQITIGFNSGAGHEDVMALIQADWKAIGVNSKLEGVEWAQWLDQMDTGDFMAGRMGWSADYPISDNFLFPLFYSTSADNSSFYTNSAVDKALLEARATVDRDARISNYQAVEKTIGDDAPVIPIVNYRHHHVGSSRIHGLVYSSMGLASLETAWISPSK